ncbi:MAG: hypothetical protein F4044_04025 [Rhodobacteraceae bacterium]|nr:hypothetical protein [Paracoccaceae bacterium]
MSDLNSTFREKLLTRFSEAGDPDTAKYQQSYMKTDMPFWGVKTPQTRKIVSSLIKESRIESPEEWVSLMDFIWTNASRREEWYASIEIFNHAKFRKWILPEHMDFVEKMVVEGAWWEIIDPIATHGVHQMLINQPLETSVILRDWAQSTNIWKRRTAILTQLLSKEKMDWNMQLGIMEHSLVEKEFFLQKAIGWVLRQYSRTNPQRVEDYISQNEQRLSSLAKREGMKWILKNRP